MTQRDLPGDRQAVTRRSLDPSGLRARSTSPGSPARRLAAGFNSLIWFMGLISLQLGIFNLLPIPILDGGHLTIIAFESPHPPRPVSEGQRAHPRGRFLPLILLFVVVMFNDIVKILPEGCSRLLLRAELGPILVLDVCGSWSPSCRLRRSWSVARRGVLVCPGSHRAPRHGGRSRSDAGTSRTRANRCHDLGLRSRRGDRRLLRRVGARCHRRPGTAARLSRQDRIGGQRALEHRRRAGSDPGCSRGIPAERPTGARAGRPAARRRAAGSRPGRRR